MQKRILHVMAIGTTAKHLILPQARRAQQQGYTVGFAFSAEREVTTELQAEGFDVLHVDIARTVSLWKDYRAVKQLVALIEQWKPDIVHTHTSKGGAVGRIAAKLYGCTKIIHTVHGFPFIAGQSLGLYWAYVAIEMVLAKFCTDMLLSQSSEDVAIGKKYGICARGKMLTHIGNGVDIERFRKQRQSVNLAIPLLITVARLTPEKGLIELLQALNVVKDLAWHLQLVGSEEVLGYKTVLETHACTYGIRDRIEFLGPRDDVDVLLGGAKWKILPSCREGVPRSLIEAHATGVPAVTTNVRGCREVVYDGVTGFIVPPRDSLALANALRRALTISSEQYSAMSQAASSRAQMFFDEEVVVGRIMSAYESVMAQT
ncbi:MAG: glycosyltransferase family 4 protein [Peptococcaceae bacterium]|nr:glycosyltransferase family 4 protein [Peptococcaceae bacterium]